ncbi:hypothetical protein LPJ78_001311 [Coemansia sp. RSA 989]|nr:trypsin-like cysteine/serine peptidase domain-containing protein [Coemansia mojavensis]KAJ1744034.1 hypothetical protein LPJ68_000418 [Coemansia sp. RSA 1086]KAJ1753507.1 hypothetical protein LPJ79_000366 [Coemansia sp. RSA 1821]KAJ1867098.1 hypothetical protein LPJ78_001311 [Coemansia sp. RSA 989]KAJ1875258.1 hypothetical protein LPJ55_000787 [Coemansia sp. RSA 990]KAJ2676659.1 hypothetical protein IWW42_000534 [Coemansia sp. RSA 1085]
MKISTLALTTLGIAAGSAFGLEKRIVGGSAVPSSLADSYSFVTNILVDNESSTAACTGALISPTVVITSASCVADPISNKALASNRIAVGQGKLSSLVKTTRDKIMLTEAIKVGYKIPQTVSVHPGYNSIAHSDNIAVLILQQPLTNVTTSGVKLIKEPGSFANTAYTAVGWGVSSEDETAYPSELQQINLGVASKSMCSEIWAPYTNLTNSLCLAPTKESSNLCNGDGLLVKFADNNSVGLAGILNMIATDNDVPASKCVESGAVDFFTTFGNYLGWLTQVTPLKEANFVSTATFTYGNASHDDESSSESESASDDEGLDDVDSETTSGCPHTKLAAPLAVIGSIAIGMLF